MTAAVLVSFTAVLAMGIVVSLIGSIKLKLAGVPGIDNTKVGALISALMLSSLVAVLIIGPLTDMLGYRIIVLAGFLLASSGILTISAAGRYSRVFFACILLGIGGMCVNTVGNVLGPQVLFDGQDPARASNLLNVFFCLGAFLTPLIVANLMGRFGYRKTLGLIGAFILIPITYTLFAVFPPPDEGFVITESLGLFGNTGVLAGGLALFCYIALESSMAGFITTYLKDHDFSDRKAGTLLGGFWISLMVARLAAVFTLDLVEDASVIIPLLAVLSVIALGIMIKAREPGAGVAGTMLLGFAMGPVFPTIVGVSFVKTGAFELGNTGSVFGVIFAMGLLGGVIVPALIGRYTEQADIRQSLKIAMVVSAALVAAGGFLWLGV